MKRLVSFHPAALLRHHYRLCWWVVCAALLTPAAMLLMDTAMGRLGPNPLESWERGTGRWSLICLALSLAITPGRRVLARVMVLCRCPAGRRVSDWNALVRMRRLIGVMAFFYALAHVGVYVEFDLGWELDAAWRALREKPFLAAGAVALLTLVPLALTSNDWSVRALGGSWKRLHRLAYLAAVAGCLHFMWMTKPGVTTPYPYLAVITALLGYRLYASVRRALGPRRGTGHDAVQQAAVTDSSRGFAITMSPTSTRKEYIA